MRPGKQNTACDRSRGRYDHRHQLRHGGLLKKEAQVYTGSRTLTACDSGYDIQAAGSAHETPRGKERMSTRGTIKEPRLEYDESLGSSASAEERDGLHPCRLLSWNFSRSWFNH